MSLHNSTTYVSELLASESERRERSADSRVGVAPGMEFRLCRGVFAFGEIIDPSRGIGMREHSSVKPGLYRVWRIDRDRVMLLALPARTGLTGPELYDERFVSVDISEMKKFRVEPRS